MMVKVQWTWNGIELKWQQQAEGRKPGNGAGKRNEILIWSVHHLLHFGDG
jgi:hypothetical protein